MDIETVFERGQPINDVVLSPEEQAEYDAEFARIGQVFDDLVEGRGAADRDEVYEFRYEGCTDAVPDGDRRSDYATVDMGEHAFPYPYGSHSEPAILPTAVGPTKIINTWGSKEYRLYITVPGSQPGGPHEIYGVITHALVISTDMIPSRDGLAHLKDFGQLLDETAVAATGESPATA